MMDISGLESVRKLTWLERWSELKSRYFADERSPLPFWMLMGPACILWSMGLHLYSSPTSALWLLPLVGLSFSAIAKWQIRGALASASVLFLATIFQGSEHIVFTSWLFITYVTGFSITAFSMAEWLQLRRKLSTEREELAQDCRLWKSRFDTLSAKYETERTTFDDLIDQKLADIQSFKREITSLKSLVDLSNEETEQFIQQNKRLTQENLTLMGKLADQPHVALPQTKERIPTDDEFLFGVKAIHSKALSSFLAYKKSKGS